MQINTPIDAALLGKIELARFLELPLRSFDSFVARIESSDGFSALVQSRWVSPTTVSGAVIDPPQGSRPSRLSNASLGQVLDMGGHLAFVHHREAFAREYRFDEAMLQDLKSRQSLPRELATTLHRLRLINSRNRLTHALVQALLEIQAPFLRSGEPLRLAPLTQAQMADRLRVGTGLSPVADAGRISRLVRGLSIILPDGKALALSRLFPGARQVHCHYVDHLIKKEQSWMAEGRLQAPLSDGAIADILARDHGIRLLRRTVADIRRQLAIPDCRQRRQRMNYLAATEGFSALMPLTSKALRSAVPAHPGVYEIRAASAALAAEADKPLEPHGVIYIGSTGDLRKRLSDHLRGNSDNPLLYRHIAEGAARVRFRPVREGWRWVERELYRVFCETFGAPPPANRMRPVA
jgi:RNA polymerase sigma-54 factor